MAALVTACCLLPMQPTHAAATEDTLRAVFLFRLVSFIEWPGNTFAEPGDPLHLCVLGDPAVGRILAEKTRGNRVFGHLLKIHDLDENWPAPGTDVLCQLSYVANRWASAYQSLDRSDKQTLGLVVAENRALLQRGAALAIVARPTASGNIRLVFYGSRKQLASQAAKLNARLLRIVRFEEP